MSKLPHEPEPVNISVPRRVQRGGWRLAGDYQGERGLFSDITKKSLIRNTPDIPLAGSMHSRLRTLRALGRRAVYTTPIGGAVRQAFCNALTSGSIEPKTKNTEALDHFRRWSESTDCDFLGRQNLRGLLTEVIASWVATGEAFVRFRRVRGARQSGIALALEVIDPGRIPTDRIRIEGNTLREGEELLNGVVFSADRRINGYLVTQRGAWSHLAQALTYDAATSEIVRAKNMAHIFEVQAPDQVRGLARISSAVPALDGLTAFSRAMVKSASISASIYAAVTDPDRLQPTTEDLEEAGEDPRNHILNDEDVKIIAVPGRDTTGFHNMPKQFPDSAADGFIQASIRQVAAAVGVPAHLLSHVYNASFSSGRQAEIAWRADCDRLRVTVFDQLFLRRVWRHFLGHAEAAELFPIPDFDAEAQVGWSDLVWQSIEPARTASADAALVASGLMSRREGIQRRGRDADEVFAEIKAEQEMGLPSMNLPHPDQQLPTPPSAD